MKQILFLIVILSITATNYAQTFTVDGLEYEVTSTNPNEVTITGGTPATTDLVIPQTVSDGTDTFTVTSVGVEAFKDELLTTVAFPTTIRTIEDQAFRNSQLASLNLPEGLTSIGFLSFQGTSITSLNLPESLISIGNLAFVGTPLTSLILSEGLVNIGDEAFRDNQLTNLVFPSTVTSIGARAFEGNNLTSVNSLATTPPSIITDTNDTFGTNRNIIDLTIPPGSEAAYEAATWTGFRSVNGIRDFEVGDTFTENNFNYTVLSVSPNEVEITGGTAVPQDLTIAGTVTSEGSNFTVTQVGNDAFRENSLTSVSVLNGITEIGNAAFRGNQITSVDLPASLVTIGFQAFINNQLTSITFPASITEIAARAFEGNPLTAITALGITPATITTGANDTFGTNRNVINLTIPPGSEADYEAATWTGFRTVNGIRDFEVGDTFTENNFNYTVLSLSPNEAEITGGTDVPQDLTIQGSVSSLGSDFTVTRIGNDAFRENSLTSVNVLIGLTEIGNAAFRGNQITSVVLPASLVTIGFQAFINNQLTSLTLPEGLTTIGGQAFLNNQLTDLTFPVGLTTIGGQAFQNNQLTSLTLPEGLTMIEGRSFQNNQLTSITFPASITDIGSRAFEDNSLAEIISLGSTPPSITTGTDDTFGTNRLDIDLTIPPGNEAAYEVATWTGFRSVNGVLNVVIGTVFTENDFDYRRTSFSPDEVQIIGGTLSSTDLSIPETVSDGTITYTVTSVGGEAFEDTGLTSVDLPSSIRLIESESFQNNQLTSLTIPTTVTTINTRAFRNNQIGSLLIPNSVTTLAQGAFGGNPLETITALGTTPATIATGANDTFSSNRDNIDLIVPEGTTTAYEAATWIGFRSINGILNFEVGDTFTENNFNYRVISLTPNEVEITGGTDVPSDLIIQESVPSGGRDFTVTRVGNAAFRENSLTSVSLPNSITEIGDDGFRINQITSLILPSGIITIGNAAFLNNELTQLLLPESITDIGAGAFNNNLLETITALGITPATIITGANDTFSSNRDNIDLTIPSGTETAYEAATWTGFRSINGILNFEVGDTFTENNFNYTVISLTPNEVEITGGTDVPSNLIIQESVPSGGRDFTVTRVGNAAFRENSLTSVNLPNSITEIGASAFRSNQIISLILPAGITTIGNDAFLNNELTQLLLPESITDIGAGAFNNNLLETITALGTTPATITTGANDTFSSNRDNIDLIVPEGTTAAYETATWTGFRSINGILNFEVGDTFTENNFNYTVISLTPNEVEITGGTDVSSDLIIQESVPSGGRDFTVTSIATSALSNRGLTSVVLPNTFTDTGLAAFSNNDLTSVVLPEGITIIRKQSFQNNEQLSTIDFPNSITVIDNNAFRNNGLTQVILPANVSAIGIQTFENNPITEVTSFNTEPPSIAGSSFSNRNQITLNVPEGTTAAYIAEGWTDFASIEEFEIDISVAPKVFLQGASLNPIAGEEGLMRDSLRENNLLPTLSPYGDGATVSPTVFTITGPDAIVDWVFLELREGPDNENTTVVTSQAAFIQRDGDIVDLDGSSSITFTEDEGDYFIAIRHRNHIGILAAVPAPLSGAASTIDFTQDITTAKGENLALTTLVNGTFAMIAGDADGSSQILNTDTIEGLTLAGGGEAYSSADADMNGFVLNSDIQLLILGNSGTVQQFE